jgi:uncharacterized membrane protein
VYKALLFIHVLAATALLGPIYVFPLLARMRGTASPDMTVLKIEVMLQRWVSAIAGVSLISGGWLIGESPFVKDRFGDARWLHFGMAVFFVLAGLASGYAGPKTAKAMNAVRDGDVEGANKLLAPVDRIVNPACAILGAVIVYLMVIKP